MSAVSLRDVKLHLNIEQSDTDHDDHIEGLLDAAERHIEDIIKRKLIIQTVTEYWESWPAGEYFELPWGKLQSITSVNYLDTDGASTEFTSADYIAETAYERGRCVLGYSKTWPSTTLYPSNPINIVYSVGYGATAANVPASIIHAVKITVSDLFENRESSVLAVSVSQLRTVEMLLRPYMLL